MPNNDRVEISWDGDVFFVHRAPEALLAELSSSLSDRFDLRVVTVDATTAKCSISGLDNETKNRFGEILGRAIRQPRVETQRLHDVGVELASRVYPSPLDAESICETGLAFSERIKSQLSALLDVLTTYETHEVAKDEINRTVDLMSSLHENRRFFSRKIGHVAVFLPCNQPLYAMSCFCLVPSLMASHVHARPPSIMGSLLDELCEVLSIRSFFPNLTLYQEERMVFVKRMRSLRSSSLVRDDALDAVIFTGQPGNAERLRGKFGPETLFIANGSGHNPIVISETADLDQAVAAVMRVQFYNQGQDCASPNSILVHASRRTEFLSLLRSKVAQTRVGEFTDIDVTVGPILRKKELQRITQFLLANREWLDPKTSGVIRVKEGIVEPTIIAKPLAEGGNFSEKFAPIVFYQEYDSDEQLSLYFEHEKYAPHAMYVTVFGKSNYVNQLPVKVIHGRRIHKPTTILKNTHLLSCGVERGTQEYGGYGMHASSVSLAGKFTPQPTLPQRELFNSLVLPHLLRQGQSS